MEPCVRRLEPIVRSIVGVVAVPTSLLPASARPGKKRSGPGRNEEARLLAQPGFSQSDAGYGSAHLVLTDGLLTLESLHAATNN